MKGIEKLGEALKDNSELQDKITAEVKRIAENKEASDPKEAVAKAVKTVLDIDLTEEQLNQLFPKAKELSPDEMEQVSGGSWIDDVATWIGDIPCKIICGVGRHFWTYYQQSGTCFPTRRGVGICVCEYCHKEAYYKVADGEYTIISESEYHALGGP